MIIIKKSDKKKSREIHHGFQHRPLQRMRRDPERKAVKFTTAFNC
jgi:hypothetical protein